MFFNFINYPAVRFKKASIQNLETFHDVIYAKFKLEEDRGDEWQEKCMDALMADDNDALHKLEKEKGKVIFFDDLIDILIDNYTLDESTLDFEHYREMILRSKYIVDIEFKDNPKQIVFQTKIGTFKVSKLSDVFPIFRKYSDIVTRERHSRCHNDSIAVSKFIEDDNKVATGYNYTFGEGRKFLHSWVEVQIDGRPFVIDTTRNLLMPRKGFYYIRNINGPVYKISKRTLEREECIYNKLYNDDEWFIKLYLSNRHQAKQVYKHMVKAEENKKMQDPDYVAAKTLSEGFKRFEKQFQKEQKKKQRAEQKQMN